MNRTAYPDIVTADVVARLNRPTASAVGLPREVYTRPEFFEVERDHVLAATWVCVGIASDVANPGDLFPYDFGGMPILLLRERAGTIRAFHNVCSHRGVQLVSEPRTVRDTITCPYHAWTYALDGALLRRPRFCGPPQCADNAFDPVAMGLKAIRCETWKSLVFVNLDGNAPPIADYLRSASAGPTGTCRCCATGAA